jgi:hypothetical protein
MRDGKKRVVLGDVNTLLSSQDGGHILFSVNLEEPPGDQEIMRITGGGSVGIGTTTPRNRLGVRGAGLSEELLSFEDSTGTTRWHINQNLGGNNSGLNFAETAVADGRIFIKAGGNVGIGTTNPTGRLTIQGIVQPQQGVLTFFSPDADMAYDGGNDGLFVFRDTGGTTAFIGGDIGIGLTTPVCKLHIVDSLNGNANNVDAHVAVIENTNGGDEADVLALKVARDTPAGGNNFITFFGGNAAVGSIQGNGAGVELNSGGADFAECLPLLQADEVIEAGDIVGVFAGKITKVTQGAHHVTAITDRPIVVGNAPCGEREDLCGKAAFMGQVPVKVRGPVRAGDYIIPSGLNDGIGVALPPGMRMADPGTQVVGRAWESVAEEGIKAVNTAIGLPSSASDEAMLALLRAQQQEVALLRAEIRAMRDLTLHRATGEGRALTSA